MGARQVVDDGRAIAFHPAVAVDTLRAAAVEVVTRLRRAEHEAYWVGGCVRDQVMGRAPKDYDVATSATPEQVLAEFDRAVPVGVQFGVVRVLVGEHEVEVATFRSDAGYVDGRRPTSVAWADARSDVQRRDFTINGLLYDPLRPEGEEAAVVDLVGGLADIAAGVVRAIGDPVRRFDEDKLRMLRAVRFAARFGFAIEPGTWSAIRTHAAAISVVSAERISHELHRILTEGDAHVGLTLLEETGLGAVVVPQVPDLAAAAARFAERGAAAPAVGWAALLADAEGVDDARAPWWRSLRLSRTLEQAIRAAVEVQRAVSGWETLPVAARKRHLRGPGAADGLGLGARMVAAGQAPAEGLEAAREDHARWDEADLRPAPLLAGRDLLAAGRQAGPRFAEALRAVEDAQLEGRCGTREEAIAIALEVLDGA